MLLMIKSIKMCVCDVFLEDLQISLQDSALQSDLSAVITYFFD